MFILYNSTNPTYTKRSTSVIHLRPNQTNPRQSCYLVLLRTKLPECLSCLSVFLVFSFLPLFFHCVFFPLFPCTAPSFSSLAKGQSSRNQKASGFVWYLIFIQFFHFRNGKSYTCVDPSVTSADVILLVTLLRPN